MAVKLKRYKNDYEKKVRREPQIRVGGDKDHMEGLQSAAFKSDSAEESDQKECDKLMRCKCGPYKFSSTLSLLMNTAY